jgi:nicotinate-nucleotide adenylyltransferase
MRIGILGGSFDPPHLAHEVLAKCAIKELNLDLVVVAVAYRQWQKQHDAAAADRLEMAQLAFDIPQVEVSDVDLIRQTPTFTIDTVADLKQIYPAAEFVFIVGADAVAGIAGWHRASELAQSISFAAAPRAGVSVDVPVGFDVTFMSCDIPDVSSTHIREVLAGNDRETPGLLDSQLAKPVLDYIIKKGLYK